MMNGSTTNVMRYGEGSNTYRPTHTVETAASMQHMLTRMGG